MLFSRAKGKAQAASRLQLKAHRKTPDYLLQARKM
jgi:hypothetical protein